MAVIKRGLRIGAGGSSPTDISAALAYLETADFLSGAASVSAATRTASLSYTEALDVLAALGTVVSSGRTVSLSAVETRDVLSAVATVAQADSSAAFADWQTRIGTSGVTYYSDFSGPDDFVLATTNGGHVWASGMDSTVLSRVTKDITDGITNGCCLKIATPAAAGANTAAWMFPFSFNYTNNASNIGNDIWIQFRFKIPESRLVLSNTSPTWAPSTNYALGNFVMPTVAGSSFSYEVTTDAGSSGTSEPTWPTTLGNTVVDGGITWTCRGINQRGWKWLNIAQYSVEDTDSQSFSNTEAEHVLQDTDQRGLPQAYHNPGFDPFQGFEGGQITLQTAIDRGAEFSGGDRYCHYPSGTPACEYFPTDEWMTFQVRIQVGSYSGSAHAGNIFDLWMARAGETEWTHLFHDENYAIGSPNSNGGGFTHLNGGHFLTYETNRVDSTVDTYHLYDQVIVSTAEIPIPLDTGLGFGARTITAALAESRDTLSGIAELSLNANATLAESRDAVSASANTGSLPSWVPDAGNRIKLSTANTMRDVYGSDPGGTQNLITVLDNWTSAAYIEDAGDYGAIVCGGSGHGNRTDAMLAQVFKAAAADCDWEVIFPLSPTSAFSESTGAGDSAGGIPEGVGTSPTPPHTYDNFCGIPASGFGNSKGAMCYPILVFIGDQATQKYTSWFLDLDNVGTASDCVWSKSTNAVPSNAQGTGLGSSVYDPVRNCIWLLNSGAPSHIGKLDVATKTWTSVAHNEGSYATDTYLTGGYCPTLDCIVWFWSNNGTLIIWKPNSGGTAGTMTFGATDSGTTPTEVVGLEWCDHASVQKFYGMEFDGNGYSTATARTLTPPASLPGTWTWGSESFTAQGGAGAIGDVSINPRYNALRWASPLKSFIWANAHEGATDILRPAAAT